MCSNSGLLNRLLVMDKGMQDLPVLNLRNIRIICICNTASSFAAFLSHHDTAELIITANALCRRAEV